MNDLLIQRLPAIQTTLFSIDLATWSTVHLLSFSGHRARPPFFAHFSTSPTQLAKRKMPPKKKVEEKKIVLGRPGNNLKVSSTSFCLLATEIDGNSLRLESWDYRTSGSRASSIHSPRRIWGRQRTFLMRLCEWEPVHVLAGASSAR